MVPADVALNHSQAFLTRVLAGKKRVLEVGCGNGQLAWRLAHLGLEVVGLDIALPAHCPSHPSLQFERGDFFQFKAEPFDAVLFTGSLHLLHPLDGAVKRAGKLLTRGGCVVLDEFDLLAPDDETAGWYYDALGLLSQAGVIEGPRPAGNPEQAPLQRWREEHQRLPVLHSGAVMLKALRTLGELTEVTRVPYLYRGICAQLEVASRGMNVAQWLLATEERRVRTGGLKGVGLRAVCCVE